MFLYSKPTQYALRALSFIVHYGGQDCCRAEQIAREEKIPKHFLSKILQRLALAKILNSVKGPHGGFSCARDPKQISLKQIVGVFEDLETNLNECAIGWARCSDDQPCALHQRYKPLRQAIDQYLEATNLATFIEAKKWKKSHQ